MKKYVVELSRQAEKDLTMALDYLYYISGELTVSKYNKLFNSKFKKLSQTGPGMALIPGFEAKYDNLRRIHVKRYVIYYTIDEKRLKIIVLRILHEGMNFERILG